MKIKNYFSKKSVATDAELRPYCKLHPKFLEDRRASFLKTFTKVHIYPFCSFCTLTTSIENPL